MPKRIKRLEPVTQLFAQDERVHADKMAHAQRRVTEAALKAQELERYLLEYQQMFHVRAKGGIGVSGMRDYQVFIARLQEAVQQQQGLVQRLQADSERERTDWMAAAVRKQSLGKVVAKAKAEDLRSEERRVQKEIDERAQRLGGMR